MNISRVLYRLVQPRSNLLSPQWKYAMSTSAAHLQWDSTYKSLKVTASQITPNHIAATYGGLLQGQSRNYSGAVPLTLDLISQRVILVLQLYDKVDPSKLSVTSHFKNDLGLDSLDHVEVIMAMEDEFFFEIPDAHAEKLMRPADIVRYVADRFDIYD